MRNVSDPRASARHDAPGSFRDPNGIVFERDGVYYREVRLPYRQHYDRLMDSGLYDDLTGAGLLVPHEEVDTDADARPETYKIIRPQQVPFISYPYEWSFSHLRTAALTTLRIQRRALRYGMTLKDASAFNIQFLDGQPALIDTLSFEAYEEGTPWVAYRQFCQHFLAPLALMAYRDVRLGGLFQRHLDGIPLDLAAGLLPWHTRLRPALLLHIHLHAKSQRRHASDTRRPVRRMSRNALLGLLDSLQSGVRNLRWRPRKTEWADYYQGDSYEADALAHKQEVVRSFVEEVRPRAVWDLGANTGLFSSIPAGLGIPTLAFDIDPEAVERHWLACVERGERHVLPLLMDLTNPSPALGWAHRERMSLVDRGPADMLLALALVHHLAISNNVPLPRVAAFFAGLPPWLVVEFVPKEDAKVRLLLASREDVFPDYTQAGFELALGQHYAIRAAVPVRDSSRTLYLMRRLAASPDGADAAHGAGAGHIAGQRALE